MSVRGVRGAITVDENNSESILSATKELLAEMVMKNNIDLEDIVSVFFYNNQ